MKETGSCKQYLIAIHPTIVRISNHFTPIQLQNPTQNNHFNGGATFAVNNRSLKDKKQQTDRIMG
jgi:hypothetical protein